MASADGKEAKELDTLLDHTGKPSTNGVAASEPSKRSQLTAFLAFSAFVITIGGSFQFGYHLGNINSLIPVRISPFLHILLQVLRTFINGTTNNTATIDKADGLIGAAVSAKAFVGFFGAFFMSAVADRIGRRKALLFHNVFNVVGISLMALTRYLQNFHFFILGRAIMGVGAGMQAGLVPMFLSELSPKNLRGMISGLHTLLYVTGVLMSQVFTLREMFGTEEHWHLVFAIALIPAFLQCLLLPFCPESPKYLICIRNDDAAAEKELKKLRNSQDVHKDIEEIRSEAAKAVKPNRECKLGLPKVFARSQRWPLLVAIGILIGQQMSGILAVIFFSGRMFMQAGLEQKYVPYANLAMGVSNLVVTMISLSLVDHPKVGRRPLLLIGFAGMLLAMSGLFGFSLAAKSNSLFSVFSIPCVILVIVFSAIGPGNIPYIYAAEIFTSEYRASAMSVVMALKWFASGVVSAIFLNLVNWIGDYTFLLFIGALVFTLTFCYFFMVETKAKTPVEVQKELAENRPSCIPH